MKKYLSLMLAVLMILSLASCGQTGSSEDVVSFTNKLMDGAGLTVEELAKELGEEIVVAGDGGVYSLKEPKNWEGGEYTVVVNATPKEMEVSIKGEKKLVPENTAVNFAYQWAPAESGKEQAESLGKLVEKLTEGYGEPAGYEDVGAPGGLAMAYTPEELAGFMGEEKACVYMLDWTTESGLQLKLKAQYDPSKPSPYPEGGPFWVRIDIREPIAQGGISK